LALFGLFVELLGVIQPYQVKLQDLDPYFNINGSQFKSGLYSNFIPQYSPIFMMTKKLLKLHSDLPKSLNHGRYDLRLYDGFDFPFSVGNERWRTIDGIGYLSFTSPSNVSVQTMSIGLINQPLASTSADLTVKFTVNGQNATAPAILKSSERKQIEIPMSSVVREGENEMTIETIFPSDIYQTTKQLAGLLDISINHEPVNIETLDIPYVSPLNSKMLGVDYTNYGKLKTDPWWLWSFRTQLFERVPDFWWFRSLYYWDLPQAAFKVGAFANLFLIAAFGLMVKKMAKWS